MDWKYKRWVSEIRDTQWKPVVGGGGVTALFWVRMMRSGLRAWEWKGGMDLEVE